MFLVLKKFFYATSISTLMIILSTTLTLSAQYLVKQNWILIINFLLLKKKTNEIFDNIFYII